MKDDTVNIASTLISPNSAVVYILPQSCTDLTYINHSEQVLNATKYVQGYLKKAY